MATRQNKISLEEVGGLLVDIVRPSGSATSVTLRAGSLQIGTGLVNVAQQSVNVYTLAGSPGALTIGNYYKILVSLTSAGAVPGPLASFITAGFGTEAAAIAATLAVPLTNIGLAYVIVQAATISTFTTISNANRIIDIRGINNSIRAIESLHTAVSTPVNKVVQADVSGNIILSRDVDLNNIDVDGIITSNNITDATDYTGNTGALGIEGGVSIAKNVFVGKGLLEQGQITIGDGATTFGHYNATVLSPIDSELSWYSRSLDTSILYNSLKIDSNNKVHIAYYDATGLNLKYITNQSGSYVITTIDTTGDVGWYPSIAIDSNNKAHISYYDNTNENLKYTTNVTGSFVISTLDSTGDVGEFNAIAVDSNNKVHISYFDNTNFDLKYATNVSGSFVLSVVDSTGNTGGYTSIAMDSVDKAHISYYDFTGANLRYATNASGSFVLSTVDSTGSIGEYTSIAIDSSDKVHISYFASTGGNLKYATNATGSFVISTLDGTGSVGLHTSIFLDSSDNVHISYYDLTNTSLKYATNTTGTFTYYTIALTGSVGEYSSVYMDSVYRVYVSYVDNSNLSLSSRYAYSHNISTAISNAKADLVPDGGKIYIKRGVYCIDSTIDINDYFENDISLVGEGSGTNILVNASVANIRVGNTALTSRVSIENIRFTSNVDIVGTSNPMIELVDNTSKNCTVNKCWFIGSGYADVDITFKITDLHVITDCHSTTVTTNLP